MECTAGAPLIHAACIVSGVHLDAMMLLDAYPHDAHAARWGCALLCELTSSKERTAYYLLPTYYLPTTYY